MKLLLILLLACAYVQSASSATRVKRRRFLNETSDLCATQCAEDFPADPYFPLVTVCANAHKDATVPELESLTLSTRALQCLSYPGVTDCQRGFIHAGSCSCPNDCTNGTYGTCQVDPQTEEAHCVCQPGWGGPDCSLVQCPENKCSGHGVCDVTSNMCMCSSSSWTGPDCSTPALNVSDLPWGCAFPKPGETTPVNCSYENETAMPWFAFNQMSILRLTMDDSSWMRLVSPYPTYSDDYFPVSTFIFQSPGTKMTKTFHGASIKLRGSATRAEPKKSWTISFKNSTDADPWPTMKLKASAQFAAAQLQTTMLMTAGVPVQRSCFTLLYFNDVFVGVYEILPNFNKQYIMAGYGENKGNYYKAKQSHKNRWVIGGHFSGDQEEGNGDESDVIGLYNFVVNSTDAYFNEHLTEYIDVESFVRVTITASIFYMGDGLCAGNNFQMYHPGDGRSQFYFELRDFDKMFHKTNNLDVLEWPFQEDNALMFKMFANANVTALYKTRYKEFISTMFESKLSPTPQAWYWSFVPFLEPYLKLDGLEHVGINDNNIDLRDVVGEQAEDFEARIADIVNQLK